VNTRHLIRFAVLAALAVASAELPAQDRERRRNRDEQSSQDQQPSTRPAAAGYSERYAVLEQRNVFVKDRSRPTTRNTSSASTQPARRSAEESLVVRGIAMEDVGYRAYVEDLNTGSTLRLSPGDSLGRGHVAAVELDAIAYEHDGKHTWIEIGSDLTGKFSGASSSAAAASSSPTTLPANVDINDPSLTVEQRMRLRVQLRQQGR
jgi:hypothetical protein